MRAMARWCPVCTVERAAGSLTPSTAFRRCLLQAPRQKSTRLCRNAWECRVLTTTKGISVFLHP